MDHVRDASASPLLMQHVSMHYMLPHSNIKELQFMITLGSELFWNLGQRRMMLSFIMSVNITGQDSVGR